eukprot:TRINITY_DN665_c0_g1_i5.p4 TRINITY_DN665_c0_g1~~TRINITY_DN665_c0_g1_i5.p4  ORF type:complete len:107 (+),score=4.36 TRINITY_DN665_c0_g1_i5:2-322(+)
MAETVARSLHHSCRSELTRQGISLPQDRYCYGRRLLGLHLNALLKANISTQPSSTGQVSGHIRHLSIQHSPVFLINSRLDLFTAAPPKRGDSSPEVTSLFCLVPQP